MLAAEKRLARRFDLCTATTRAEWETLNAYGTQADTDWFPNGVDADYFCPTEAAYDAETPASARSSVTFSRAGVVAQSAVANALHEGKVRLEDLFVKEAVVGAGPTLKRWLPRAQGRATPLLKRTSHVSVTVATKESL